MDPFTKSITIKKLAAQAGFQYCGISKAEFLESEAPKLEAWLKKGMNGKMAYLENNFDKRLDPRILVPEARSVISFIYNYYPDKDLADKAELKIATYAYGEDYHKVIKDKLHLLMKDLKKEIGDFEGRAFVDSAPIMERQWAQRSGIGWIGKNSLLLNPRMGSFFFLAELIVDIDLEPDAPIKDYCGTCTACMDACPTDAIYEAGTIDSNKCISYLTIELKESIPVEFKGKMENWIFGCDICQLVCPWNRFSTPNHEPRFRPLGDWPTFSKLDWTEITEVVFQKNFEKSALTRTGYSGLKRNIDFVAHPSER